MLLVSSAALAQTGWRLEHLQTSGGDLNAVYFDNSKRGWAAGDNGFLSHTEDGGRTWTRQVIPTDHAVNDIYFRNGDDGFILAGNLILTTNNGGQNWREVMRFTPSDSGGAIAELYSIRFSSKKRGWIVGSLSRRDIVVDSLLLSTDDGGASWQSRRVPTRDELIHVDFVNDHRGWIVGAGGTILHTEDEGVTWTEQRSGVRVTLYHVDFNDTDHGWAVGERGTILRTLNGGDTWMTVAVQFRARLLSVQFANGHEGWAVGRGGLILHSEDSGETWVKQESNTRENLYALFVEKKRAWAVGGDGTVLHYER
ncbi:MAG TPA: YCF48-related protein [Pyrinomonadaceae bacterium]|nr:YCF48-related protein [Pyrinomonadaceae bacterium]